jgi:hypothetical protein
MMTTNNDFPKFMVEVETELSKDQMYNLAAQAFHKLNFTRPQIISWLRDKNPSLKIKFYTGHSTGKRGGDLFGNTIFSEVQHGTETIIEVWDGLPHEEFQNLNDLSSIASFFSNYEERMVSIIIHELGHAVQKQLWYEDQKRVGDKCQNIPKTSKASCIKDSDGKICSGPSELWCEGLACEALIPSEHQPVGLSQALTDAEKELWLCLNNRS